MPPVIGSIFQKQIRECINQSKAVSLRLNRYLEPERQRVEYVVNSFLEHVGIPDVANTVTYCVHELALNAKKANTKRAYFADLGVDPYDPETTHRAMQSFKRDTLENLDYYEALEQEMGLQLQVQFHLKQGVLKSVIRNNVGLYAHEQERIRDKLRHAERIQSLAEAYGSIQDDLEGAGLGIVMLITMLRGLGLNRDVLRYFTRKDFTSAVLTVDTNLASKLPELDAGPA